MAAFRLRFLGREIGLPERGSVVAGRGEDCEINLDDPLVSRHHATFVSTESGLSLLDHGSKNGTQVNGVPVVGSQALAHRDRVQMGSHIFVVLEARDDKRSSTDTLQRAAATRRVDAALRAGGTLEALEAALERGDVTAASAAMTAIVGHHAEGSGTVPDAELPRLSKVLLLLSERGGEARFFEDMLQLYANRKIVPDAALVDAIQAAIPRLPGGARRAIEGYLDAMHDRTSNLPVQEQARLRRLSTLARKNGASA